MTLPILGERAQRMDSLSCAGQEGRARPDAGLRAVRGTESGSMLGRRAVIVTGFP